MAVNILTEHLNFPEGPVVTPSGDIYFVELLGGCITQYHRSSGKTYRYDVGGAPNGMMVKDDNTLIFCDSKRNAIRSLDVRSGETEVLADQVDGEPLNAPNDLIQDDDGNILFTCPGDSQQNPVGYMCVLTPEGDVSKIADKMYFPNGLLLINNDTQIIINETWQHRLVIGDWNKETLQIENIKPFFTIGGNAEPDGLAYNDNHVYAAVYNTGKVWKFDLSGKLIKQIDLPGNCPTNLYHDHVGSLGLIVTEAEKGLLLSIT